MSRIKEIFTYPASGCDRDWRRIFDEQTCRYTSKKCFKVRKSNPEISIGTCTVEYGKNGESVIICPHRLLERKQIFLDCLHLLSFHVPGNELHIVSEVGVPGGSIDYVLVSTDKNREVKDFVGIELQTLDTTGTVWPERQRLTDALGLTRTDVIADKSYGINWKMSAKTILMQLLHKIETFESLNRHLVLVVQDCLLDYMRREFSFAEVTEAKPGDSMHFHAYGLFGHEGGYRLGLERRLSTDSRGIARLLGLNADANIRFEEMANLLRVKISDSTVLQL